METKANYVLIGAFTLFGFLGMLGFLMWFAKLELNRQFAYYDAYFPEVSGLSVSSPVLFAGLSVGKVVDMRLAPGGDAAVRVRVEVGEDTPVRSDSLASLETSAVTGVSTLSITSGSRNAPLLSEVSEQSIPVIRAGRSTLQTLGQQAPELLDRLNTLAEQLQQLLGEENQTRVAAILTNVESASGNLDKTMADISTATEAVAAAADDLAGFGAQLHDLGQSADDAMTSFTATSDEAGRVLAAANTYLTEDLTPLTRQLQQTADRLQTDLGQIGTRAQDTLTKMDTAFDSATGTLDAAHGVIDDLGPLFADLRQTLSGMNEAMAGLPEALPRITDRLGVAADSAAAAFESLRVMLDSSRKPVQAFTNEALPQFSRLSSELRGLVGNVDQLVSTLRRNPGQVLRGQPTPEFRR